MKYCLTYRKGKDSLMNKADELTIIYNRKDTTLLDFLLEHKNQRINILIQDVATFKEDGDMERIAAIKDKHSELQIFLQLDQIDIEFIKELEVAKIPYFFSKFANNWDTFNGLIKMNVSDIYVVEDLGFNLDICAEKAHAAAISIRVFPNIAQSQWKYTEDIKKFFIRPEDIDQYEPYIDTIEFISDENYQDEVLYDVYAIKKEWFGPLKEIIRDFNNELDSRYVVPRFAENRIKCGKRCAKNSSCSICETIEHLSNTLKDKEILVKMKKVDKK